MLAEIAMGILGAGSSLLTNRANSRMAEKQMAFQERLSSTSAQRAVKDYEAAGLNPALAYDRGASSPGGASATLGNSLQDGINTAERFRAARLENQIAREQARTLKTQAELNKGLENKARSEALVANQQERALMREDVFRRIEQPLDLRLKAANAALTELGIPGARNTANFETRLGAMGSGFGATSAKTLMEAIKTLNGIRR